MTTIYTQTGGIWPCGVPTSLSWLDIGAVLHLAHTIQARAIVEIGVEHGGLAAQLIAYCNATGSAYLGCDVRIDGLHPTIDSDLVLHTNAHVPETYHQIAQWIEDRGHPHTLFICDGGDKPKEILIYSTLIRPGDVLIGHDYQREYGDESIANVSATMRRVTPAFLGATNWCMFVHIDDLRWE